MSLEHAQQAPIPDKFHLLIIICSVIYDVYSFTLPFFMFGNGYSFYVGGLDFALHKANILDEDHPLLLADYTVYYAMLW